MQRDFLHSVQCRCYVKLFLWSLLVDHAISWDYAAHGGDWDGEGVCLDGRSAYQSPIELPDGGAVDTTHSMYYMYPLLGDPVKLTNDGKSLVFTIPATYKGGFGMAETPEEIFESTPATYRLWHVTFHSPSEHTRNGVHLPLEVQLTHKEASTGQLAVVSVFFTDGGQPHSFLNVMLEDGLPQNAWDERFVNRAATPPASVADHASKTDKIIDFWSLVQGGAFFEYEGSLTQPPCTPEVQWLVRQNPIAAEAQQLAAFRELFKALDPPDGNFRTIQMTGTRAVKLIAAVDINDPKMINVGDMTKSGEGSILGQAKEDAVDVNREITGNEEFEVITGKESPELLEAKRSYQNAKLSAEGAKVAYIQAKAKLAQAQDLYDRAPGMVEKIDLKWVLIDKKNILNAKIVALSLAMKNYDGAMAHCVTVLAKNKGETLATTTPIPTEAGSTDIATTRLPTDSPPIPTAIPGYKFNYNPKYTLPSGTAGNPFVRTVAESTPRIGGISGQAEYFPYLKQNLNQPEGPENSVPVPSLVKVTTTTEPPPTTAPPVRIDLKLNVPASSISDMPAFKEGLAEGLASSAGVNVSRIKIENVTATTSSALLETKRITRLRQQRHHDIKLWL